MLTFPLTTNYTVRASQDRPAKHYRATVYRIGGRLDLEVTANEEGYPSFEYADGSIEDLKSALAYDSRLSPRQKRDAIRALVPAGFGV